MVEPKVTPIAVIGMGCRLPGGIDSPELLWEALLRGDDLITEIPADRWDLEEHYDPQPGVPGRSVSRWGGFVDDVGGFDAEFFGIGDREAAAIDPQHRLMMETAWEAVEHAGLSPASLADSSTGVFAGLCHDDYTLVSNEAGAMAGPYGYTCTPYSMASGRIAYALGLRGPALTIDSSCSSGLLAVHLACRSLHEGESDYALAGGCQVILEPSVSASASAQGMLSPTGRCRTFDVGADGFVRSDGCAVVLLKRMPDALRDGDRILAVIRGTAANQDGRSVTLTTPSLDAQADVYRAALDVAGVDAATVGMVEAHGTGTPVGDPLEFGGLAKVYGTDGHRCIVGSAKSNLGHTESAAGTVGLVKAILGLRHGAVPAMAHFTRLPDDLGQIETGLLVPKEITPWPTDGHQPRRAAVSSFGMSGTNVHAVLEQAPETAGSDQTASAASGTLLFPVSATSDEGLRRTALRLADWVEQRGHGLAASDLAYTLARRRGHRSVRTAVLATDLTELAAGLREVAESEIPYPDAVGQDDRGPVWVFSGQGSQWAAMGAELLAREPAFAARVAELEPLIARESGFSVSKAMSAPETVTGIDRVQPTLFAMQVALAEAMRSYGVHPGAVIGHSMGEAAAAVVAGALSLEDGVRVICRRSRLMCRLSGGGAMASVELTATQVRDELAARGVSDVVVSVFASPESTVIGGATDTVRELVAAWEARDVMAREVAVDVASHSPQVDPILADLAEELAELAPMEPKVPYYSATLDNPRARPAFDALYWVDNLRQPVRFANAVQAALDDGHRVFGEPAPHPLLTRAVEQTANAADISIHAVAGMRRDQPLPHGVRVFVCDVHNAGAAVDFAVRYPGGRLVDAPLPTWTHRHFLIESDGQDSLVGACTALVHPLLGEHVRLPEEPERHAWQADVGTGKLPWLADHKVNNVAAYPGAAYCEMALAAAELVFGESSAVRDVQFEQLMLLDEHTEVTAVAAVAGTGVAEFAVAADQDGERVRQAVATLSAVDDEARPAPQDIARLLAAYPNRIAGDEVRQWFAGRRIQFGPAFTGLVAVHTSAGDDRSTLLAEIALPGDIRSQQAGYGIHPALLDACFQSVAAVISAAGRTDGGLMLPLGVARLRRVGRGRDARYCVVRVLSADAAAIEADLDILDADGEVVLQAAGLRIGAQESKSRQRERIFAERLLTVEWNQQQLPAAGTARGAWLLVVADDGDKLAVRLSEAMASHGADCRTVSAGAVSGGELASGAFTGVVVVAAPAEGDPNPDRGRDLVASLVGIAGKLANTDGEPPRFYVITRGALAAAPGDTVNLDQGGVTGLLRVIGAEHPPLRPTQIDVDADTDGEAVASEVLSGSDEDSTAWRQGSWYTARLRQSPLRPDERRTTTVDPERDGMRLVIRTPGDLDTLEFVTADREPPQAGQIEVAVDASSINFADVLLAFGKSFTVDGQRQGLGVDFAGVVTAVGAGVTDFKVGDRVGALADTAAWSTFVTCDARLAAPLPESLTTEEAAAVSTAYATAWYSLHQLARIQPGDRVLIHSATGGVGQAAIAIARHAGAEIFATAGSDDRRELLRQMGIKRVYDSRTTDFADQIRSDTDGYGVDVVLNSLTGAAQRAGLELLAFDGRFVEIGKRDVYEHTRVDLYPFRRNLAFYYADLLLMSNSAPGQIGDLLRTVYGLVADGTLPTPEYSVRPLTEADTAIREMSAAQHTGKLILTIPRGPQTGVAVPPTRARVFRKDGSYIVTGGVGGLGLFLASAMASAGCGRIILTSRSQPNPQAQKTIDRLRANGADVVVECGNIADPQTATRLVSAATATGLPLRGVLHAAAVVDDATLGNITDELIDRDWAPKVHGAWHLHRATAGQPLDWFCSFSSVAALFGSPGQGAYAAANSWLDAFTAWRRTQGLPATAIAWGAWDQIGRGAGLAQRGDTAMITPQEGAHAFRALLRHDRGYTAYLPLTGAPWLAALAARSPVAEAFRSADAGAETSGAALLAELRALSPEQRPDRLRRLVTDEVALILRRAIDPDRPFAEHGLDSLGNLELRTHIETQTGVRVTPKTIVTYNTARTLAGYLTEALSAGQVS
ncbi:sulfolipid-1 biosynthesis phthioceranic/hydroxyphthioceranic acid synthase [Candidatus Mycolicibacterium alkanivorans]|uniref:Type I polyketide synthase n=1 Tax=Candidatus Mycolicibacterium alkanivorans TaxID=2954114 RepID=A0ABS9YSQ7_9MYCO|nr:sulfolipid-1 biosynthesis phthioceranic/hydroxyphthioceranic acid synthase [Candidatus Mycolicibacterium alkanivorans]MCI4674265.1 type I polyketide synthase [Candidatus Mycolicibacterium alkanivorans]